MEKQGWSDYDGNIYDDDYIGIVKPVTSDTVPDFNMTLGQTVINKSLEAGEVAEAIKDTTFETGKEFADIITNVFNLAKFLPLAIVGVILYKVTK